MPYYSGDHLIICDRCGFKRLRSTAKLTWQNWLVCYPECWEVRHPQDITPPSRVDRQWVREPRPKRPPTFVGFDGWTEQDDQGIVTIDNVSDKHTDVNASGAFAGTDNWHAVYYDYGAGFFPGNFEIRFRHFEDSGSDATIDLFLGVSELLTTGSNLTSDHALNISVFETGGGNLSYQMNEFYPTTQNPITDGVAGVGLDRNVFVVFGREGNFLYSWGTLDKYFGPPYLWNYREAMAGPTDRQYRYFWVFNSLDSGGSATKIFETRIIKLTVGI